MLKMIGALLMLTQAAAPAAANDAFWEAARAGDLKAVSALLDEGVDVNARARYDMTALSFAADKGHLEVVRLLVARGADLNLQDTFYRFRPIDLALSNGHASVAVFLLERGSQGADAALQSGVGSGNRELVGAALASPHVTRAAIQTVVASAERLKRAALVPVLKTALDARPAPPAAAAVAAAPATPRVNPAAAPASGSTPAAPAAPAGNTAAAMAGAAAAPASAISSAASAASVAGPRNWPSFRGEAAAGNGDGQRAVTEWDVANGTNIKWKTAIPGMTNSSPVVWGSRVFTVAAASKGGDNTFRTGLYGDVKPVDDLSEHEWKVYCLDKATGKILWERTAYAGAPKVKRHTKASQANSTPATDGRRVVAAFGSVGVLAAWDIDGKELWRKDLGVLDSGWFLDPSYQWGHSSSPIIYRNSVILQADRQKASYLAAWDLDTGRELWRTLRDDEISTWGTPAIVRTADGRDELVTNGTRVRGYDPATGALRWTLGPNSEITIATPVAGHGLVFVTGGYPPVRPIYAIRPGASGDISLPKGSTSSGAMAWSNATEGTYIPTPIVYRGLLFTLNINGVMTAYNALTGERAFRGRVGTGGSFSASPVAADGRLYVASEDGDIYIVEAAEGLKEIAKNPMNEVVMGTMAISDGLIIVRTLGHVYGIGR